MFWDAFHDHRAGVPPVRQRAPPQKRPRHQRGAAGQVPGECERTFILEPAGPRYDEQFKEQVLAAYQDRMSTRGIRRTFGVCYKTPLRWLGEKKEARPAFTDTRLPSEEGDVLEPDELWSFVGGKTQTLWRWVAL
jgi:hypothetical protein